MTKKNVLVFFTDDQRYSTIHALGCEDIKTPNLDAFIEESTAFTTAHIMGGTCGAVCMPSRAMLMTGRSLFRLDGEGLRNGASIPKDQKTMPEWFRENGYYTHHIGKWHQDRASFNRSFQSADRIFGFTKGWYKEHGGHYNVAIHDFDPACNYFEEDGYMLDQDKKTKNAIKEANGGVHSTEMFCDSAISFIENYDKENPFFMYLATVAPHDPRQSPEEFEAMYDVADIKLPENYMPKHPFDNGDMYVRDEMLEGFPRRKHAVLRHISDYYAMISHIDEQFGRVVQTLKNKGMWENTIVVFAGDNGLALGSHGLFGKQNLYDHSVRVPFIIRDPENKGGKRTDELCYLYDLFPTLCKLNGLEVPSSVDGISLDSIISSEEGKGREYVMCAYRNYQRSVRNDKYKLIRYYVNDSIKTQLFDLSVDPNELNDLYNNSEYLKVQEELLNELHLLQKEYEDPLVMKTEKELRLIKY